MVALAVDSLLAVLLLALAWRIVSVADLFEAGVVFIVFGLLLAVIWLRLDAPDIALAEAAIGAGVTGALYLNTLAGVGGEPREPDPVEDGTGTAGHWLPAGLALVLAALMVGLVGLQLTAPPPAVPALGDTGKLTNPVTAVLLDVRAYDTLLETAVLIEALMGVWILGRAAVPGAQAIAPALRSLVRLLAPVMVVVAGAVLWNGTTATGGAFQAAAILAAAGILLRLGGFRLRVLEPWRTRAVIAALGTAFFLVVGVAVAVPAGSFLAYPAAWQKALVTAIEAVATLSIAAVLVTLFDATVPERSAGGPRS